jgi:serine/threonine-protein kinase
VKFTRTGDPDPNKVADPGVLPPRGVSPADGFRGSYRETTSMADGTVLPPKVLQVDTYCLRTGDRCMSLGHSGPEIVTLMFADDKWTRDEQGTSGCPAGTAQVTITAEYPMPQTLDDPISALNGRGTQTIAPGSPCTGGGDFQDRFERTGD